jgi:histidyl-tRNA synthetase
MKVSVTPPRGMRDILPSETELRDASLSRILAVYRGYGFERIETPALESLDRLRGGEGGENEKLIFKILKRGEALDLTKCPLLEDDLADLGLRFDLTVPLARYYANNINNLPKPFKAIQVGPVWRAERPQKGRFRQFTQCDIDVIDVASNLAELELVLATSDALLALGFAGFTIRINDRRLLTQMAEASGFSADRHDQVFIALDKLDKIGMSGVRDELAAQGHPAEAIDKLSATLELSANGITGDDEVSRNLAELVRLLSAEAGDRYTIQFDPTLVRGMGYYTGPIFEVAVPGVPYSLAGGGRYDRMIGKSLGREVPACGFSIGFERIIALLQERTAAPDSISRKLAVLCDPRQEDLGALLPLLRQGREQFSSVSLYARHKNTRKQIDDLQAQGIETVFSGDLVKLLTH